MIVMVELEFSFFLLVVSFDCCEALFQAQEGIRWMLLQILEGGLGDVLGLNLEVPQVEQFVSVGHKDLKPV